MNKYAIVIPVYNEEDNVLLIAKALEALELPFLFIDDGSTDKTATNLWLNDIPALCYYPNRGKSYAIRLGANWLINEGYEYIMVLDGDGQHSIENIEKFDNALLWEENKVDIFIGNRMNNITQMPKINRFVNKWFSLVISKLCAVSIPDTQCGFRLYNKRVFETLDLKCERFDGESEILVKAGRAGMGIKSIPIECI